MTRTLIALETSTEFCSVALRHAGQVTVRRVHAGQTHSERLLPMLAELLAEAGIAVHACEAIAFGAGPGSFTGLRIACSVAQGLAYGLDCPVIAVDTLRAMAEELRQNLSHNREPESIPDGTLVLAALDARMQEVYWAVYAWQGGEWQERVAPGLSRPADVRHELAGEAGLVSGGAPIAGSSAMVHWGCGNGFDHFSVELSPCVVRIGGPKIPDAEAMAALAERQFARGETMAAQAAAPLYVRNRVALTTLERAEVQEQKQRLEDVAVQSNSTSGRS